VLGVAQSDAMTTSSRWAGPFALGDPGNRALRAQLGIGDPRCARCSRPPRLGDFARQVASLRGAASDPPMRRRSISVLAVVRRERFWFYEQLQPGTSGFVVAVATRLDDR